MPAKTQVDARRKALLTHLEGPMKGVTVDVAATSKWKRPVVTVRWNGFEGLLAEQRFRRVMRCIPPEALERDFQGLIWFELTTDETVDDYLKMPRSDDVRPEADQLLDELRQKGFFDRLRKALGKSPEDECADDFKVVAKVLRGLRCSQARIDKTCLALLSVGKYCDCEALELASST